MGQINEVKLAQSLAKLATNPVKADNQAIQRLEKETGCSLEKIIEHLENSAISCVALESYVNQSKTKVKFNAISCCVNGVFFACLVGLGTMYFKPTMIPQSMALAFGVASARTFISEQGI